MNELPVANVSHEGAEKCACHGEASRLVELDARAIPHEIRHAAVFGALDSLRPERGLVLLAPHDPVPLLAQLERRSPAAFAVEYLDRGPETWRVLLVRRTAAPR
ncbi:DUF2249 domain-containing protein [Nocardioides montaniterrae]